MTEIILDTLRTINIDPMIIVFIIVHLIAVAVVLGLIINDLEREIR